MTDPLLGEIGKRIRSLRLSRKMTQARVAEGAGIEASFYGQVERGRNTPSLKTLAAIARTLKVAPADLLPDRREGSRDRYGAAIEGIISELPKRERGLLLGVVSDIVARLKR